MITYEAGTIPSQSLTLVIKDGDDNPVSLIGYDNYRLEMLGSDNEPVDLKGVNLYIVPVALGVVSVVWPKNRSVFTKRGKYVLRLVLEKNDGTRDITRAAEIRVREFGRLN